MDKLSLPVVENVQCVPHVIYQTWETKELPDAMANAVKSVKDANPTFEHRLYDNNERREYIKINYPEEILYAYDTLIPGALRADLWRYCILYINGGIYLDIKFVPANGFKFEMLVDKEHYCKDHPTNFKNGNGVINGLLIVFPGNLYLKEAIRQIYLNCVKKTHNFYNQLYVSGPGLLSEIVPSDLIFTTHYSHPDAIKLNNKIILTAYKGYRDWLNKYYNKNKIDSYQTAWRKKRLFK
jgi:hypothetical protein